MARPQQRESKTTESIDKLTRLAAKILNKETDIKRKNITKNAHSFFIGLINKVRMRYKRFKIGDDCAMSRCCNSSHRPLQEKEMWILSWAKYEKSVGRCTVTRPTRRGLRIAHHSQNEQRRYTANTTSNIMQHSN